MIRAAIHQYDSQLKEFSQKSAIDFLQHLGADATNLAIVYHLSFLYLRFNLPV